MVKIVLYPKPFFLGTNPKSRAATIEASLCIILKPFHDLSVKPYSNPKRMSVELSNQYKVCAPPELPAISPKRCSILNSKTPFPKVSTECPLMIRVQPNV